MDISKLGTKLPQAVLDEIPAIMEKFGVSNPLRLSHFLAQCGHESGHFKFTKENLNYSADGLRKIFPKYFPTNELAAKYARQPEKIANKVYGSRMGNGDEASGDGFRFRGRGFVQPTGQLNFTDFDKFVEDDILADPDLVASKYPLMSAAFFFHKNKLWDVCDKGHGHDTVLAVTKRVNGGTIGLTHRIAEFENFKNILA
jgi:putative chitinase